MSILRGVVVTAVLFPGILLAEPYALIVCGAGRETNYEEQFASWGQRLRDILVNQCGHAEDKIILLTQSGTEPGVTAKSSRESALSRLRDLGVQTKPDDPLFVFLIGHGSYRHDVAKLNVEGPDLTADDLSQTLDRVKSRRVAVLNTASVSAPFINILKSPGRIVATSTRSRDQVNATRYAESSIQALEDGSSDLNRDDRISFWEAASQAAAITSTWYKNQKQISSEQAILDENGDGKGTRLFSEETVVSDRQDGELSKRTYLKDVQFDDNIPEDWIQDYREAIGRLEEWIAQKNRFDSVTYLQRLEALLIDAAVANRRIRESGGQTER